MMKQFDFPVVFKYIVGYLQTANEKNEKQRQSIVEHVKLPNRYPSDRYAYYSNLHPVNHTKEYSFGKKRLVEIKYRPQHSERQKTYISSSTQKNSTTFGNIDLRKTESHKTHIVNSGKKCQNIQGNKSQRSLRYTNNKNNSKNSTLTKNVNKIEPSFGPSKRQTYNPYDQNERLKFDNLRQSQQGTSYSAISIRASQKSIFGCGSKKIITSPRQMQRYKTEFMESNNQQANENKGQIKKMTNFMLRKQKSKNLTRINHRQNFKGSQNKENDVSSMAQRSMKKKTTFLVVSDDFSNKTGNGSIKIQSNKKIDCGQNQAKKQSVFSISEKDQSKKRKFNLETPELDNLQIRSQKVLNIQFFQIKKQLKRSYRVRTLRFLPSHLKDSQLLGNSHQSQINLRANFRNDHKNQHRVSLMDSMIFKKKQLQNPVNYIGNTKIVRRIKRQSGEPDTIIHEDSYQLIPSSGNLSKKPLLFSKNKISKQGMEMSNVFNQLDNFHAMMQDVQPNDDGRLENGLQNKNNRNNAFRLLSENDDRKYEINAEQRKKVFNMMRKY